MRTRLASSEIHMGLDVAYESKTSRVGRALMINSRFFTVSSDEDDLPELVGTGRQRLYEVYRT